MIRTARWELPLSLIANTILGLSPTVTLLLLAQVIDAVAVKEPLPLQNGLWHLAGWLLVAELAAGLTPVTNNRIITRVGPAIQEQVLRKAVSLPLADLEEPKTHDLMSRAWEQSIQVVRLWQRTAGMLFSGVRTCSAAAAFLLASPILAGLITVAQIPVAVAGARQARRLFDLHRRQTQDRRMQDYLTGLVTGRAGSAELRSYQLGGFFTARWRQAFRQYWTTELQLRWRSTKERGLADVAAFLLFAVALAAIVYQAAAGQISPGQIVALVGLLHMMQQGMESFISEVAEFWQAGLPLVDLRQFLAAPSVQRQETSGLPFVGGPICFESVSFTYPGQDRMVLADLSFTVYPGEKIALVGQNGAGKSTLVKLLLGLYEPTAGRITIGGRDLREIAPSALQEQISCVFQGFGRYALTLSENVRAGRQSATDKEVAAACSAAGIVADQLPHGGDTLLGKEFSGGLDLSGGQWQRVALARAFLRNAPILMLDEPTAALDPLAELELFEQFSDLAAGRTAFLISHRLGAARLADRVLVLEDGRLVESGTHAQLIGQAGRYAKLFSTQAQWYQEVV